MIKHFDLNERNANLERKLMSDEVDKMYQVLRKFFINCLMMLGRLLQK